jgi:signal transduction histidine kinase
VEGDPSQRARIDSLLVMRAVENLVANAFRFVRAGDRIRIAASQSNGALVLAVQNSGPPVRPEVRPALFRGRNTQEGDHKNAGLGLYFCRLVAEAHGGVALLAEDSAWNVEFRLQLPGQPAITATL